MGKTEVTSAAEKKTPLPVVRRLSIYHDLLVSLKEKKVKNTSSTIIADILEYKPIQVRKDLEMTGLVGKPKIGYDVEELLEAIKQCIGWSYQHKAVLFGVGNLGSALLNYPWMMEYGLVFEAAFDTSAVRSNILIYNIPVHHTSYFNEYIKRHKVDIAVITVPPQFAQDVANMVVSAGIKAIWNFTVARLKVPSNVIVENASFTISLAVLTQKLSERKF
jgi:redox-sensing transcriptional repressor